MLVLVVVARREALKRLMSSKSVFDFPLLRERLKCGGRVGGGWANT